MQTLPIVQAKSLLCIKSADSQHNQISTKFMSDCINSALKTRLCPLCRPALHIYNWLQTALRGLVTLEDTLNNSVYDYLQAYKQKDFAQVLHRAV